MSPEAQRIAIAEACGWKNIRESEWGNYYGLPPTPQDRTLLPDYLNDLDAMHEAEKELSSRHKMSEYESNLKSVVYDTDWWIGFATIHATAAQRAEAFLRTLGLWEARPTANEKVCEHHLNKK